MLDPQVSALLAEFGVDPATVEAIFTGAVYLATHGFPARYLATAIGFTQCFGMLGGAAGQFAVAPLIHADLETGEKPGPGG